MSTVAVEPLRSGTLPAGTHRSRRESTTRRDLRAITSDGVAQSVMVGLGESGAFWLYAAFCLVALAFIRYMVPETKGLGQLENIQKKVFSSGGKEVKEYRHSLPIPNPPGLPPARI